MFIYNKKECYDPLTLQDAMLFHNMPLNTHMNMTCEDNNTNIKLFLTGLYRREIISIDLPHFDDNGNRIYHGDTNKIIENACNEKWPLENSFSYKRGRNFRASLYIEAPEKYGSIIPDWLAVSNAARIAAYIEIPSSRDAMFVSLYNEILETSLLEVQRKYSLESLQTSTGIILNIGNIPEDVKRFVLNISATIERETGNNNRNTFDFVRVRMSIPTKDTFPNRREFIRNNMEWFIVVSVNKLNSMKKFTRYGVPATCLSLKKATIVCTSELELLFELKDRLRNMQ